MSKCNWSGNPIPKDSFKTMAAAKTVKTSRAKTVKTKPKHPAPRTS